MDHALPIAADVAEAYSRLREWVVETPVLESAALNERLGLKVLFKAECLQHTGSFKIRGALNRLLQLKADEREAGVVAFSSGNHAQAVALAAHWLQVRAVIVMPSDAPAIKLESTRAWGAEVVLYDRAREDREAIAHRLVAERGAVLVPPFDHPHIIAGQGTAALELARFARERRLTIEKLYVPCSGGGLVAGSALAVKAEFPECAVYAVEPQGFDDTARSLAAGKRCRAAPKGTTLCDGLMAAMPGAITFAVNRRELAGALVVDDEQVRGAMAFGARRLKLVLEPSGAAALAAVLATKPRAKRCIAVMLSGGNVDAGLLAEALGAAEPK
jgi:threonine dehydratase